jgi:hypothetical protein
MEARMNSLGERAVKALGFRWMPGMLSLPPQADRCQRDGQMMVGRLPDLTDPATLGCLLALVREAWGDETVCTAATREADGVRGWVMDAWVPLSPANEIGPYPTEGEVLVAALEAAERQEVSNES